MTHTTKKPFFNTAKIKTRQDQKKRNQRPKKQGLKKPNKIKTKNRDSWTRQDQKKRFERLRHSNLKNGYLITIFNDHKNYRTNRDNHRDNPPDKLIRIYPYPLAFLTHEKNLKTNSKSPLIRLYRELKNG